MNGEGRLEILNLDFLEKHSDRVMSFRGQVDALGIQMGWHYDLDLPWIASKLRGPAGLRVLDAGAEKGELQRCLAVQRAHVMTVDRFDASDSEESDLLLGKLRSNKVLRNHLCQHTSNP